MLLSVERWLQVLAAELGKGPRKQGRSSGERQRLPSCHCSLSGGEGGQGCSARSESRSESIRVASSTVARPHERHWHSTARGPGWTLLALPGPASMVLRGVEDPGGPALPERHGRLALARAQVLAGHLVPVQAV